MIRSTEKWKCLIVDDEPLAAGLLKSYVAEVAELELVEVCNNALDALALMRHQSIDLVFLDIQMPRLSGLSFLRSLSHPPKVIFTTAFREYAVEGFELEAADYLVKPISLERFLKAIQRLLRQAYTAQSKEPTYEEPYVYYRVERQQVKVLLSDILWIESQKDYLKIVLMGNKTLITYQRISYAEENLPASLFLRIHRSFILAKNKVTSYNSNGVWIGDCKLPVGNSYKRKVQEQLSMV